MVKSISQAFEDKLQTDGFKLAMLIDLETNNYSYRWTDSNRPITYTLSSNPTEYLPFPGTTGNGLRQSSDLGVSVIDFIVANTGSLFGDLVNVYELDYATVKIGRVFTDTPDLGRLELFQGELADYSYDRNAIAGQVRNQYRSNRVRWPHYNYQDKCAWRFGSTGCGIDTTSYEVSFTAANIEASSTDGLDVTFVAATLTQSYANARFNFGRLTVTDGPNSGSVRTIRNHTGDLLQLSHQLPVNSFATFGFTVYPGCRKRRIADCKSIYNNAENFLGHPWIPIQEDGF